MNHSDMTDEDAKSIAKQGGKKLSELTGLDHRIGEAIISVELKGSNFGKTEKQFKKNNDHLKIKP